MKQRFLAIVSDVLEEPNVSEDSSASTLGNWDSVGHMNLILALEQEFGMRFQEQEIPELMSCRVLMERIEQLSEDNNMMLPQNKVDEFTLDGVLILPGFYSLENEILPIERAIHDLIGKVIDRHDLDIRRAPFSSEQFDDGLMDFVRADRRYAGEVYDVVKMIPAFVRLACSQKQQELFECLRPGSMAGTSVSSQGIRIDLPAEDKFRSGWHQEYLYQPQSRDGIVFWSPLVRITEDIGPLQVCPGSQREGLLIYRKEVKDPTVPTGYSINVKEPERVTERCGVIEPLLVPGDLAVMDYLTLHQSGYNQSQRARWSMQMRLFNFNEPEGTEHGWPVSITAGTKIEELFEEFIEIVG